MGRRTIGIVFTVPKEATMVNTTDPRYARFEELQGKLLAHYGVEARSRFVHLTSPALRAHVLEAGRGEPVIMLHGGDGEAVNWAPFIAAVQDDLHVFAVDRPGFGLTDRFDYRKVALRRHAGDFVTSLLDALGLDSATIIGGSMGGFFALATALDHPERVRRIVLIGMPVGLSREVAFPLRLISAVPALARRFMKAAGTLEGQHRQYRQMFKIDPDTLPAVYFEARLAGVTLPGVQATWATLLHRLAGLRGIRPEVVLADELPRVSQPTLTIWGEHDMASVSGGREAIGRMPNASFVTFEGGGHFPFLEQPERCARLVVPFVQAATVR